MTNKGQDNLVSLADRTTDEKRAIGIAGGKASGKARREKKRMREWAEMFRDMPIQVNAPDGTKIDTTFGGAIVYQQMQLAITKNNTKASKFIADLLGEMEQNVNIVDKTPQVVVSNKETAEKVKQIINADNEDI